tara:strand:+ start:365 stop:592 length:228 start_codon:yes stop_codon:yes gene_type:complete
VSVAFIAALFFYGEHKMHLLPAQINRLERDMNELKHKIRRYEKRNNIVKAEILKEKLSYMEDTFLELHTYHMEVA